MDSSSISWKWVVVGAGIIIALNQVMIAALKDPILATLTVDDAGVASFGAMFWVYLGVIAVVSYMVGGFLTGWFSPGETVREPAMASALAVLVNLIGDYAQQSQYDGFTFGRWFIGAAIMLVIGFFLGMAGGWLGERAQGDTTEKMRERGELPPT